MNKLILSQFLAVKIVISLIFENPNPDPGTRVFKNQNPKPAFSKPGPILKSLSFTNNLLIDLYHAIIIFTHSSFNIYDTHV